MKRFILSGALVLFVLVASMMIFQPLISSGAEEVTKNMAASPLLADRHATKKIDCQGCHDPGPPKAVSFDRCFKCHQSYKHVASLTEDLAVNPHESHFGEIECLECHKAHKKSGLYCNKCHEFKMDVP
jgi:fumarate reductase flavoprotein subunit